MACGSPQSEPDLQLRFDGPHHGRTDVVGDALSAPAEVAAKPNGLAVANLSRVRNHASQLADHLQSLSDDIDRREAELNSREARVESNIRGLHLSIEAQQHQLCERVEQIDVQENAIRKAAEKLRALENSKTNSVSSHLGTTDLIRQVESVVANVLGSLPHPSQRGSQWTDSYKQSQPAANAANAQQQLDRATAALIKRQKKLEEREEELSRIRQQDELTAREMHSEFTWKQQNIQRQWDERKATLQRRAAALDDRQQSLDQSRREIANSCRETLQLFLDAEQLWSRIPQLAAQPQLALELERIGRQLMMGYGAAQEELRREKRELEAVEMSLKNRHAKILREKERLEKSLAEPRQSSKQRDTTLATRERQWDQQQADSEAPNELWNRERRSLQQQILELQSELQKVSPETKGSTLAESTDDSKQID